MAEADLIRNDLAQSAAALSAQPLLVGITVGLVLAPVLLSGPIAIFALPIALFEVGFVGTQRIWFLRAFRGKPFGTDEIWPLSVRFFGRLFVLGVVTSLVASLLVIPVVVLAQLPRPGDLLPGSFVIAAAVVTLVIDVALTFVVPALCYTTRSVREGFRIGFGTIRDTWPRSVLYVLTPGIAATLPALLLGPESFTLLGRVVLGVLGALLALWFKGAIAAYYLRLHPETPDDGAANLV
jgi:hypothetical protein